MKNSSLNIISITFKSGGEVMNKDEYRLIRSVTKKDCVEKLYKKHDSFEFKLVTKTSSGIETSQDLEVFEAEQWSVDNMTSCTQ